jgi:hypothetical protein
MAGKGHREVQENPGRGHAMERSVRGKGEAKKVQRQARKR